MQVSILGDECCCLLFVHVVVLLRSLSQARLRTNNPLWKYGQRALKELSILQNCPPTGDVAGLSKLVFDFFLIILTLVVLDHVTGNDSSTLPSCSLPRAACLRLPAQSETPSSPSAQDTMIQPNIYLTGVYRCGLFSLPYCHWTRPADPHPSDHLKTTGKSNVYEISHYNRISPPDFFILLNPWKN